MRAILIACALLTTPALAGCLTPTGTDAPPSSPAEAKWAAIEALSPDDVTFTVLSRAGGQVEVTGYAWWPDAPVDTVLLAVHGIGGNTLPVWGPADGVPAYSAAHRVQDSRRAMVAIDLPGYGRSDALREGATLDDYAHVVAQVAGHLRAGTYAVRDGVPHAFPEVVGLGWSMGGFLVVQAQGHFAAFDAIVPTGWSDVGFREEARACMIGLGPCPTSQELLFKRDHTDLRILDHFENNPPEPAPGTVPFQAIAWTPILEDAPAPQDASKARVNVPVLWLVGAEDFWNQPTTQDGARRSFAASDDVTFVLLEDTAHALFHHLNHESVYATVLEWLDERGW